MDPGTFRCFHCGADYTPPPTDGPPLLFKAENPIADAGGSVAVPPAPPLPEEDPPVADEVGAEGPTEASESPQAGQGEPEEAAPAEQAPEARDNADAVAEAPADDPATEIAKLDAVLAGQATSAPASSEYGIPRSFWIVAAMLAGCLVALVGVAFLSSGGNSDTPSDPSQIGITAPPQSDISAPSPAAPGGTLQVPGQSEPAER